MSASNIIWLFKGIQCWWLFCLRGKVGEEVRCPWHLNVYAKTSGKLVCPNWVTVERNGEVIFFRESVNCFQSEKKQNIAGWESIGGETKILLTASHGRWTASYLKAAPWAPHAVTRLMLGWPTCLGCRVAATLPPCTSTFQHPPSPLDVSSGQSLQGMNGNSAGASWAPLRHTPGSRHAAGAPAFYFQNFLCSSTTSQRTGRLGCPHSPGCSGWPPRCARRHFLSRTLWRCVPYFLGNKMAVSSRRTQILDWTPPLKSLLLIEGMPSYNF